jgi:hypothetical protein
MLIGNDVPDIPTIIHSIDLHKLHERFVQVKKEAN